MPSTKTVDAPALLATSGVLAQPLDAADNDVVALDSASDASVGDLFLIDREYMSVVEVINPHKYKVLRAQKGSKIAHHGVGTHVGRAAATAAKASGVLAQPLDAADNDVVALDSASDASVGDLLLIDREYMSVTEVINPNNLKVLRAQEGSKIATHDIGATVRIGAAPPGSLGILPLLASPAVESVAQFGRIAVFANLSGVIVTVAASSSVYATAAGGLPIDLAPVLTAAAPFSQPYLNPADVVGVLPVGTSTNLYTPGALTKGTPTYAAATYPFSGGGSSARPAQQLTSAPAWVRLQKGGVEIADGANTDTFTMLLLIARGGTNDN